MVARRYVLTKWTHARFRDDRNEIRCYAQGCGRALVPGDQVVSRRSGGRNFRQFYCLPCARRLNII